MQTLKIGDVTITSIIERDGPWRKPEEMFPAYNAETGKRHLAELDPRIFDVASGRMVITYQTFVVRTPHHTILVDTCCGNGKNRPDSPHFHQLDTPYLERLKCAGVEPEDIDYVLCTHLHVDHVGWNTMLVDGRWVPTFPNARYLMGRVEHAHWTQQDEREDMTVVLTDSVTPVWNAGLVDLVETDHRICEEISLVPTPVHTPGHVSVRIASGDEESLITGDFMHHPCQIARPEWSSTADSDPAAARQTRERMLTGLAGTPTLVVGTHFAGRTAGHVVRDGDAFRLAV